MKAQKEDIFVGDFNIDVCSKSRFPKILLKYIQLIEFPTYMAGSILDHAYVKKSFLEDYEVEIVVPNIFLIRML